MTDDIKRLSEIAEAIYDAPMAEYTSFKAGGKADALVIPRNEEELKKVLEFLAGSDIPTYIMGNGSNILVKDGGFRGVIVKICEGFDSFEIVCDGKSCDGDGFAIIEAGTGISLAQLAKEAQRNSLTGLEFASGIPGSLGGAMYMNAGAYDGEMKNVVISATAISYDGLITKEIDVDDMDLGYRKSVFQETGDIVLKVRIKLEQGDPEKISSTMKELAERRNTKQPVQYPSAGSFFKRPPGHFAGGLIQDAGLKGLSVGGAEVSTLHAGFIINKGGATATDIVQLMHLVQGKVKEKFDVDMEPEVRIIGEDPE